MNTILYQQRFLILSIIVLIILPFCASYTLATEILVLALAAMGCNVLLGYTGLLSFGQSIFFGMGGYIIANVLLHTTLGIPMALIAATVGGTVCALAVGWFAIQRRGTYFVMLTLAFGQLFYFIASSYPELTGGENGLSFDKVDVAIAGVTLFPIANHPLVLYVFVALLFLLVYYLLQRTMNSYLGRTLIAIRENEVRAKAIGYNVRYFKLAAFAVSGAVTGLAGGLSSLLISMATLTNIEYHTSEIILIITVIGGTGNLFASLLGSIVYNFLSDFFAGMWDRWLFLLGMLLVAICLFMQQGLWGILTRILPKRQEEEE